MAETVRLNRYGYNTIARQLFLPLLCSVILFWAAGTLDWFWGWVFSVVYFACWLGLSISMGLGNPKLTNERGRPSKEIREQIKDWDKVILGLYSLAMLVQPLVAGLDKRFGWSGDGGVFVYLLGNGLLILAFAFLAWSMVVNRHFDAVARIQNEANHQVISAGPYGIVRHPGYLSVVIQFLAIPMALSSWAALLVGVFGAALFIIRTGLEDRLLQDELAGYKEFTQQTRYRLFPMIW